MTGKFQLAGQLAHYEIHQHSVKDMDAKIDGLEGKGIKRPVLILQGKCQKAERPAERAGYAAENIGSVTVNSYPGQLLEIGIIISDKTAAEERGEIQYPYHNSKDTQKDELNGTYGWAFHIADKKKAAERGLL